MPSLVMLLRHAEKPLGEVPPHGVSIDGTPDPESLTPRGWQRAGALVGLFTPGSGEGGPTLPTPTHLFASLVGIRSSSERPRETLVPLAERLGLAVDSRFRKEEVGELVRAVQTTDGVVLIAWEHHLLPSIANMLVGDPARVPQIWPDDRYDVVWVVEGASAGTDSGTGTSAGAGADTGTGAVAGTGPGFRQVPEMLLAGDRPEPIAGAGPG